MVGTEHDYPKNVDVLVVGAGPVGLMTALCVATQGLSCRIIDAAPEPEKESRAIGIQSRTLEVFEMGGFVEEFLDLGHPLKAFNLHGRAGERIMTIDLSRIPSRYRYILTLPQDQTERILTERLRLAGVEVERPLKLRSFEDDGAKVRAQVMGEGSDELEIECDWLIGCDGAHSRVRQVLGLQFSGQEYDLQFMLADVQVRTKLSEDMGYGFSRPDGLVAVFPMGNGHWRLIADNPEPGWEQRERPSFEEWQTILDRRVSVPMEISDPNWMAYFQVNARIVERLRKGRVFVLGDAAHIHSPALAQGMNTGLQDAWNLGWKLALVQKGLATPELVDSYEAERHPVEQNVLKITDFTQTVVATTNSRTQAIRDFLAPLALRVKPIGDLARMRISELNINYRGSRIVENSFLPSGPHAGERAPDAEIELDGERRRLFSLFGREHVLLVLPHPRRGNSALSAGVSERVDRIRGRFGSLLRVYPVVRTSSTADEILDRNGDIARSYGGITALYLVRPDGYIGYRSGLSQIAKLEGYLDRWFAPEKVRSAGLRKAG